MRLILALGLMTGGLAAAHEDSLQDGDEPTVAVLPEAPRWFGHSARPEKAMDVSIDAAELAAWNLGGMGDPDYPSSRSKFHAASRVIVDTRVLSGRVAPSGKVGLTQQRILAQARSRGYWLSRICYEALLREHDAKGVKPAAALHPAKSVAQRVAREQAARRKASPQGKTVLRFSIAREGKVSYVRRIRSELPVAAAECLKKAWYAVHFDPAPRRRIDVEVSLRLSPGDAPVPALEAPAVVAAALPDVEDAEHALAQMLGRVGVCYDAGLARDRKLWGRVELRLSLDASGKVLHGAQGSSRFPDAEVVACVQALLQDQQLPVQIAARAPRPDGASLASPRPTSDLGVRVRSGKGSLPELVVAWRLKPGQHVEH